MRPMPAPELCRNQKYEKTASPIPTKTNRSANRTIEEVGQTRVRHLNSRQFARWARRSGITIGFHLGG